MAIKTERVTVGDAQFEITQLGAEFGRGLYKKFVTAIGPLLRELLSGSGTVIDKIRKAAAEASGSGGDSTAVAAVAVQIMGPMILRAVEALPDALFNELCVAFAANCTVGAATAANGQRVFMPLALQFNDHFAGDYVAMTAWLGHCVRVNGFLGLLGSGSAAQPVAAATA